MKEWTDTLLGLSLMIAIVGGLGYITIPKGKSAPTIEVKLLSAKVNGRLYTKEAAPKDFASDYVVMPADDDSGEVVILPWSVIEVSKRKVRVSELVDGLDFYNEFVSDLRAKNDPKLPEALRIQGLLGRNLTPEEATAVYQEVLRRRQTKDSR